MVRVLVVDDEELARGRLRRLLAAYDDLEVIGEAEDGEQAIERILALGPDLVFLDIQMPGCSGMEVAASLPSPRPGIIFCTAFDEFAVDAFELHAVDYLLKPVSRARLDKAVDRARGLSDLELESSIDRVSRTAGGYPTRFLAKRGTRYRVIPRQDVLFFASEGGLTKLQTIDEYHWMQPTLTDLEARLDPSRFCRISRAAVVNLDAVEEVIPLEGGSGRARLINGRSLEISRRRLQALMDRLSET